MYNVRGRNAQKGFRSVPDFFVGIKTSTRKSPGPDITIYQRRKYKMPERRILHKLKHIPNNHVNTACIKF